MTKKMEPTSSVRRPESGTWQSVAMETAQWEAVTGTHDRLRSSGSSIEEAVTGAHGRLRAWQQQWEARNLPAPYDKMEPTAVALLRDLKVAH
ncbi:unnamed protein product, partial [Staurois parvus]